jgi:DNA polymerase elongation subunit (family B)
LPFERKEKPFRHRECQPHERRFGSSKNAINDQMPQVDTPGLIQFDAMRTVKALEKLDTYSLKEVALKLLKGKVKKKDLPHALLSPFWAAGPKHRRRLAIYNYYDVKVTLAVMVKRFLLGHVVEVARAAWTSVQQQMLQGAQIKTWNLIVHFVHKYGWLLDERNRQLIQRAYGIECEPLPRYIRGLMPKFEDPEMNVSG